MKKLLVAVCLLIALSICTPTPTFAAESFSTSSDVTYTVEDNAITHAVFNNTLINTTSQYFATAYKITLGFTNITNVKASDPNGPITPNVTKTEDGYVIQFNFNKKVVGLGNSLAFTFSFDTNNIAQKQGNVWEVNVPGLTDKNDFSDYTVHIKVPTSFGSPTFIKPQFITPLKSQEENSYYFTKEQLQKSGISIGFGTTQLYNFSLTYHLRNNNLFPVRTDIALPPSTNYQDVVITDIDKKPANVVIDADGNWLAEYYLLPSEKKDIVVKGQVKLSLNPKQEPLSEAQLAPYLQERQYWETSNDKIKQLAMQLKTPSEIYAYVVKTLNYDFSRVNDNKPRLGAAAVLSNPSSAVCLEFTDLFIAIARSAGIPAREVDGFANTQNGSQRPLSLVRDILHAWPEYYDRDTQAWIMIDPTWANTTGGIDYFSVLDFDHIAFVIKGLSSTYPVPAGGYKTSSTQSQKDVDVVFATQEEQLVRKYSLDPSLPTTTLSGFPIKGTLTVKNIGTSVLSPLSVSVLSDTITPLRQKITFGSIPPFGHSAISFTFDKTALLTNMTDTITISDGQNEVKQKVKVTPFIVTKESIGGIVLATIVLIISGFAYRSWRLRIPQSTGGSAVRGQGKKP